MDVIQIIDKYYSDNLQLENILLKHSCSVAEKSVHIAISHPELNADIDFLFSASMLHDIGIFLTDAPGIQCYGDEPYIKHGLLGAHLLETEGLDNRYLRVCSRHTGTGLTKEDIITQNLPLPPSDLIPETIEEQIICFADKFFSKTRLNVEKTTSEVEKSLEKFGNHSVEKFQYWCKLFL